MPKINYVIACWTGGRHSDDRRAVKDRTFMIRHHLDALEALAHSLTQITIVLAEGGDERADDYIKGLKSVAGTPVVVLVRENTGYSYASWNLAFETYKESFSHYIIVEDDYMPWVHNFDSILVDHADRKDTYVCGLATRRGAHGAISNGIIPSSVWSKVHPAPWASGSHFRQGNQSQRIWTECFGIKGFPVQDYTDTHSSPFWLGSAVRWYGDMTKPPLFMPTNAMGTDVMVTTRGGHKARVRVEFMGTVTVADRDQQVWDEIVSASIPEELR